MALIAQAAAVASGADGGQAVPAVDRYATCLAKFAPQEVADTLDSGFDSTFDAALETLPVVPCGKNSTFSPGLLRGALFASMYRRYTPHAGNTASNILESWTPALPTNHPLAGWYVVSACLVDKEPDATRELLRAEPGSAEATRHFRTIVSKLPNCLPANQEFKVTREALTGLIAETVYQIDFATQYGDRKRFR